jgi:hypothetical protein
MKLLTKLTQASAAVVVASSLLLGASPAFANGTGQIVAGNNRYQIADLTKGTGFANTQSAQACDTLQYRLSLYNPGPDALGVVKVEAGINTMTPYTTYVSTATAYTPDGAIPSTSFEATLNISTPQTQSYVANSTQLLDSAGHVINSSAAGGTLADTITLGGGGINIGGIGESVTKFLQFQTKLSCPTPPPTPSFSCTVLGLTAEENRTVKISNFATAQANGATFTNAVITWGDNSTALTSASPIGHAHQYGADGTYTVTATAHFNVNGQDKTAGGPTCTQNVTFSSTKPPVVTPPTTPPVTPPAAPTALVNTGPGSTLALFAAATIGGTVLYRRLLARRLSRQ